MKTIIASRIEVLSWVLLPILALISILQMGNTDIFTGTAEVHFNAMIANNVYILLACQQVWRVDNMRSMIITRMSGMKYLTSLSIKSILRILLFYGMEIILAFCLMKKAVLPELQTITIMLLIIYVIQFVLIEVCVNSVCFNVNRIIGFLTAIITNIFFHYYIAMYLLGKATGLYGV